MSDWKDWDNLLGPEKKVNQAADRPSPMLRAKGSVVIRRRSDQGCYGHVLASFCRSGRQIGLPC